MRHAFALGAFALLVTFSGTIARADQPTAHVASTHVRAASNHASMVAVQDPSPDIAAWTAENPLIVSKATATKHGIPGFTTSVVVRTSRIAAQLTRDALRFLGTPYVFGGTSTSGFDCSGYTQHVFAMMGVTIPRTADAQYYAGGRTVGGMRPGDLVFFQTYLPGPSHVGIYLGHGHFVHAASHGVMVSSLSNSYWSARYIGAKRLLASR